MVICSFIHTDPHLLLANICLCIHIYLENNPVYNLVWYKKKGDSAANSIACSTILTMTLRESSRPVSFLTDKGILLLSHEIDEDGDDDCVEVRPSKSHKGMYMYTYAHICICIHPNGTNSLLGELLNYVCIHTFAQTYTYKYHEYLRASQ